MNCERTGYDPDDDDDDYGYGDTDDVDDDDDPDDDDDFDEWLRRSCTAGTPASSSRLFAIFATCLTTT